MSNVTEKAYDLEIYVKDAEGDDVSYGRTYLAKTYGNIDVVAYVANKAVKRAGDDNLSVEFHETDELAGDRTRRIMSLTADPESVQTLLKKRITAERKAARPGDAEDATATSTEAGDVFDSSTEVDTVSESEHSFA